MNSLKHITYNFFVTLLHNSGFLHITQNKISQNVTRLKLGGILAHPIS